MIDLHKTIAAVAASVAALGGSYTIGDKFGLFDKPIIEWAPDHFHIKDTRIGDPIPVTVARIKKRDDCAVEAFVPLIRDNAGVIHEAVPSNARFAGPAGPEVDTFTYYLIVKEAVAPGRATLVATIKYKCPEGERIVSYPKHKNLTFYMEN
ncbi:MAG: hypothetical protein EBW87_05315 [Burkholderiaceae bacterium]|nr:hypothetical protein [Burkholderiaceae bacterium]